MKDYIQVFTTTVNKDDAREIAREVFPVAVDPHTISNFFFIILLFQRSYIRQSIFLRIRTFCNNYTNTQSIWGWCVLIQYHTLYCSSQLFLLFFIDIRLLFFTVTRLLFITDFRPVLWIYIVPLRLCLYDFAQYFRFKVTVLLEHCQRNFSTLRGCVVENGCLVVVLVVLTILLQSSIVLFVVYLSLYIVFIYIFSHI